MCTELEVTLQGQMRTSAEREELLSKWDELSNYQIGVLITTTNTLITMPSLNCPHLRSQQLSTCLRSKRSPRSVVVVEGTDTTRG